MSRIYYRQRVSGMCVRREKDQLKCILTQKVQDMSIQQYRAYLNEE